MLKWKDVDVVRALIVTTPGRLYVQDATPADIIACLKANPEAAALVVGALEEYSLLAAEMRRTEAAERERDEWAELWATSSRLCDEAQARADRALGITPGERGAAIAAGHTSGTPDASSARVAGASPRGQDSTPEPAKSSCPACKGTGYLPANYEITGMTGTYRPWSPCPLCAPRPEPDPESPATRREVEELRRQVERLEGLTGFGPEE